MYVDETVLKYMTSQEFETTLHTNENVEATVAFIDICSFTSISENASPDTVVKLLNTYFDVCLLYTSPSPRDRTRYRMPSSA